MSFRDDFEKSRSFYLKNRGIIEKCFQGTSKLFNVEFDNSAIAKLIDTHCGIDYLLRSNGKVYGLASRINFNKNYHGNVTIRYKRSNGCKTEFGKRVESIQRSRNGGSEIYASITMQIDAHEDEVRRVFVFESDKLYMVINSNLEYFEQVYLRTAMPEGNTFFKIPHEEVSAIGKDCGFRVMKADFEPANLQLFPLSA